MLLRLIEDGKPEILNHKDIQIIRLNNGVITLFFVLGAETLVLFSISC